MKLIINQNEAIDDMEITISCLTIDQRVKNLIDYMFFIGAGGGMLNVVVGSIIMKAVPQEMMGRVSAFNAAIMQASMPIASFICSGLALKLSVTQIFGAFGILTMISYLVLYCTRRLNHLDM